MKENLFVKKEKRVSIDIIGKEEFFADCNAEELKYVIFNDRKLYKKKTNVRDSTNILVKHAEKLIIAETKNFFLFDGKVYIVFQPICENSSFFYSKIENNLLQKLKPQLFLEELDNVLDIVVKLQTAKSTYFVLDSYDIDNNEDSTVEKFPEMENPFNFPPLTEEEMHSLINDFSNYNISNK